MPSFIEIGQTAWRKALQKLGLGQKNYFVTDVVRDKIVGGTDRNVTT